ncbi:hypothetical protein [Phytoactinopolyspora alkaliphila]|uniref:hypothetical protein n=1 Tax=Phytoactinopolyspora alkaliphila TaxID=1783498 RepID=UPI001C201CFD|nr:hypothetical protein [Phytoactinopolyspora alkaliphila]
MGGRLYPRRFALVRHIDYTGVSGVGVVAYGVVFFDGHVALRWCSEYPATSLWNSIDDLLAVHGHGDATSVQWIDDLGDRLQSAIDSSRAPRGRRARRAATQPGRTPAPQPAATTSPAMEPHEAQDAPAASPTPPPPPPPEEDELPPWPSADDDPSADTGAVPSAVDQPPAHEVPMVPPQRRSGGRHRKIVEPSEESAGHR